LKTLVECFTSKFSAAK